MWDQYVRYKEQQLPHWKCVMRCCAKCPRIDLTSLESDDQNLNFSPTICFHVHHIIARWTVHDRHPFNENRQCWFCESYTDSIVTAKLYTGKELVMMETSVLVFHQKIIHTRHTETCITLATCIYSWNTSLCQFALKVIQVFYSLPQCLVMSRLCRTCSAKFFTPNPIWIL